ncbi:MULTISPECIES: glycosyltransferase [unclassified Lentimonas]|uniref:glycosyltransferase n=1 Tax=unclassified Lentimonas TaxID=2630993 RepID=UPI00132657DF|nr:MULTISPECIES: glycosyltransferase [unclassified Lentimonas]CAA6696230.1 Unannotated [Lentimonas sp. CC10]CAA6697511.1 Unannotated [Lentimonas sp. CC19]CAA7071239.1 Unannotated [Lentimonas sp. CC11]
MKTIILADTAHSGHRRVWLAAFADTLIQLGHQVVVLVPDPEPVRATLPSEVLESGHITFKHWELPDLPQRNRAYLSNLITMLHRWRSLSLEVKAAPVKPDLVILPYLDAFVSKGLFSQLLNRVFSFPWYGIFFQPQWTRINTVKRSKRPSFLFETVAVQSKHCQGIGILDEGVLHLVEQKHGRSVDSFPDFIYPPIEVHSSELGQRVKDNANRRKVISFVGTIQSRKGFESFLRLMDTADPSKYYFLIAGKFTPNCFPTTVIERWETLKEAPPENVTVFNGSIEDDQDYYDLFRQSDVIWGAYEDWPHSSNVLTLSAAFNTPLLVSDHYLMAERVLQFKLGTVLPDERSGAALLKALKQLTLNKSEASDGFVNLHSLEALSAQLSAIIALKQESIDSNTSC